MKNIEKTENRYNYSLCTLCLILFLLGSIDDYSNLLLVGTLTAILVVNAVYVRYLYCLIYRMRKNAEARAVRKAIIAAQENDVVA